MSIETGSQILAEDVLGIRSIFHELAGGQSHEVVAQATWEDWDISAIVPVGTKEVQVLIWIDNEAAGTGSVGVRTNGSSLDRSFSIGKIGSGVYGYVTLDVPVAGDRIIECYSSIDPEDSDRVVGFNIIGYWDAED